MARALFALLAAMVATTGYFFSRTWLPALASSSGGGIDHQIALNLILLGVIFVATQMALGLFLWKYREGKDPGAVSTGQPNASVELAWLTLAAVLFLGLNVAGAVLSGEQKDAYNEKQHDVSSEKDRIFVDVYAVQFRWYFHYAGADGKQGITKPELVDPAEGNPLGLDHSDPAAADDIISTSLVLPAGRDVQLDLHAQDVIHSFFVPGLRLKQDAVPGQNIWVHIAPMSAGTYDIACAQLCGMGHYQMNAQLKVVPEAEYKAWLAQSALRETRY